MQNTSETRFILPPRTAKRQAGGSSPASESPFSLHAPRSSGATAYKLLADEFLKREESQNGTKNKGLGRGLASLLGMNELDVAPVNTDSKEENIPVSRPKTEARSQISDKGKK